MAWRYTFDGGPEKPLDCEYTEYRLAALVAFAREKIEKMPTVRIGVHPYDGHVLKLWDDQLVPEYGPYHYGIGENECGSPTITTLS